MGKNLLQQRRGKGSIFKSPSFNFRGRIKYPRIKESEKKEIKGVITELITCPGHSAPLMEIKYETGQQALLCAPEGIRIGEELILGEESEIKPGNIMKLKNIPEGTLIFNIESRPGDGGKFVRSSGTAARVVAKDKKEVTVLLPSKKTKLFLGDCLATIGTIAGGGKLEKPLLKAGKKHWKMKKKRKIYPKVSGVSMNSIDHPFGGTISSHKGRPTIAPRNAPAGRKVGKLRPRRTGKKK